MRSSNLLTTGFIAVMFIMLPNNRFYWTAFTKEGVGLSLFFFWGGGGTIFPRSRFIKAIISIHMYIVRLSICHPLKYQTSKFFFLDFQN